MHQYLEIILMLFIFSVFATIEYVILRKRISGVNERKYSFYIFSFFFSSYYFILSAMKYYLGYKKENLFDSFWDLQPITLVHYGIPLLIISIIAPFLLQCIFKDISCKIIRFFDSTMFLVLSFTWLLVRAVNNRAYCVAFIIAILISAFAIFYLKKNEISFVFEKDTRQKIAKALPFIIFWLISVAIYIPNELYLNNASDFPMSYWYFFGMLLLGSLISVIILCIGMVVYLTEKQLNIFCVLMFVLLIVGYIQGMLLNGSMGVLDGSQQAWNFSQYAINIGIWIILAAAIIIFSIWKKEKAYKIMRIVCVWLTLTQIVSLGVMIISSDDTTPKSESLLTTDGLLEVGEHNNIIVFVLDRFDGRRMDEILETDPNFLEPLQDFTYYENAESEFSPTENSIPYLITGATYNKDSTEKYISYAYDNNPLITDMNNNGYDIGIYTNSRYVPEEFKDIVSNYKDGIQRTCNMWDLVSLMTQCSRYRMAPFVAKEYYQYDTSDIELLVTNEKITNIENDIPFYNKLINEGLKVNETTNSNGTFRFIHMHGAHAPYTMTEQFQYIEYDNRRDDGWGSNGVSQAKGALKIVYEYIRQLKELGKYDDSTIIITADHGYTESLSDSDGNMIDISFPILFVKENNQHNNGTLNINKAPVCHENVIATIRNIIGVDTKNATLDDISENDERVRTLKICSNDLFEEYEINGDVRDINSWKLLYSNGKYAGSIIKE